MNRPGQLSIALGIGTLDERQRLEAAYLRCHGLRRRMPFESAIGEPLLRHCLELTAISMQRKEERNESTLPAG